MVADPQRSSALVSGHTHTLSSQDPTKQGGAHAYSVDLLALRAALDGGDSDVMVEAKGKEHALTPLGTRIG